MRFRPVALVAVLVAAGLGSCGGSGQALKTKPVPAFRAHSIRVPDVVGESEQGACTVLGAAGLMCGAEQMVASAEVPLRDVVATNPAVGDVVARGSEISLLVSGMDASVVVPDVMGDTAGAATSTLAAAGLTAITDCRVVADPAQDGTVVSEDPVSGISVLEGSAVTMDIARPAC